MREHGAVTVDWVVLTSGMAMLVLAVSGTLSEAVEILSTEIANFLKTVEHRVKYGIR